MLDTVRWVSTSPSSPYPGRLRIIDQTRLPEELVYLELHDAQAIFEAIQNLRVRGAPAIGCAAAYGLAAIMQDFVEEPQSSFLEKAKQYGDFLASARPTAVNLSWAIQRCWKCLEAKTPSLKPPSTKELWYLLWKEADAILQEDRELCRQIGKHGSTLLWNGCSVLTHCNAGALATSDYGTALAPLYIAYEQGLSFQVFADETRPLLQGARLTAWELQRAGISVTVICDNMAGWLMKQKRVDLIIVGADRIAANGDTANKIGTYSLAVLAHFHQVPFYIAAPYSTIDLSLAHGGEIPIEERSPQEVLCFQGKRITPSNVSAYNPAFDITPHELISGIITEKGILTPPFQTKLQTYAQ